MHEVSKLRMDQKNARSLIKVRESKRMPQEKPRPLFEKSASKQANAAKKPSPP